MGQGRRQTERITIKQARSERQAANDQERRSTVQVVHGKTNWENRSEMLASGKQDFAMGECMCAAYMWVWEWGAGVGRQSRLMSEWWQLCNWCNGGRECVCAVHDGRCSPRVMCSCGEWQRDSWHIYNLLYYVQLSSTGLGTRITHFCLQNCLNSSWHGFNKVLETFLRDFGPYWHDSITQLLQICRLHIHDANLPFHHITKMLYWIEIWWLWGPFE